MQSLCFGLMSCQWCIIIQMELLKSVVVDSVPSLTELVRFGLIEALRAVKSVLLLYPLNIFIFFLMVYVAVRKLSFFLVKGKKQFKAVYDPLPHHESSLEDLKLIKKEVREVQAQLIALLKGGEMQQGSNDLQMQQKREEQVSEQVGAFLSQVRQRSAMLQQVQGELKQAASQAFAQISKMNQL